MMRHTSSGPAKRLLMAVPLFVFVLVALLVAASTNSSLLDRFFPVLMVLNVTAATVLTLLTVWMCLRLFLLWKKKRFGSKLTIRMALQVAVIAVLPSLLLYTVSSRFIGRSIDSWFNVQVEQALDSGVSLSRTVLSHYQQQVTDRVRLLGNALADLPQSSWNRDFPRLCERYGLTGVVITGRKGEIIAASAVSPALQTEMPDPQILLLAEQNGSYSSLMEENEESSAVREKITILAAAPVTDRDFTPDLNWEMSETQSQRLLDSSQLKRSSYFLVAHEPLPQSLEENITALTSGYRDYQELILGRSSLRSLFTASLTVSMLLAALSALIAALSYAQLMTEPVRQLARGTRKVAEGNLSPIQEFSGNDEINMLTQSFNDMIGQLAEARNKVGQRTAELTQRTAELTQKTEELTQTSQYLKSVLTNLSSGVLVVDQNMRVVTSNEGAARIFGQEIRKADADLKTIAPAVSDALSSAGAELMHPLHEYAGFHREIEIAQPGSAAPVTLFVRASLLQQTSGGTVLLVLVIDDVTQVIAGQRATAWGEVARRLAHEIKNPLTPIQLAAERLEMKLSDKLGEKDSALLSRCISTIVTQVGAMKQMVDDFRNYAKLPPAVLLPTNLNALLAAVSQLYRDAGKPVEIITDPQATEILADEAQLRQVLHNLVGNALDALSGREDARIVLSTETVREGGTPVGVQFCVTDNGPGFSPSILHKSFEPYVTTKPTGTGLGLPMVKKIADEHKADIRIRNLEDGSGHVTGAQVSVVFRLAESGK